MGGCCNCGQRRDNQLTLVKWRTRLSSRLVSSWPRAAVTKELTQVPVPPLYTSIPPTNHATTSASRLRLVFQSIFKHFYPAFLLFVSDFSHFQSRLAVNLNNAQEPIKK